jgi:hypothetical protein
MAESAGVWKSRFKPFLSGRESENRTGGTEYQGWCPIHQWDEEERHTPAAYFNFEKGVWHCKSQNCNRDYPSFKELWADVQESIREEKASSGGKKRVKTEPLPSPSQIQRWCDELMSSKAALEAFVDARGLSLDAIAKFHIGYIPSKKRYSIPVYDSDGSLVDVRQYRLNARDKKNKMISVGGHGGAHLFLPDALEGDEIILTEGELDAIMARDQGFNSMTHTSGAEQWQARWNPLFSGKKVYVCYDGDDSGAKGARKTANGLLKFAREVYIVTLSLPNIKKADITDFFHVARHDADDFRELLKAAEESKAGQPNRIKSYEGDPVRVSVSQSLESQYASLPLLIRGTVTGKGVSPSVLPRRVHIACDQQWGDKCKKCFLDEADGRFDSEVDPKDEMLLNMVGRPTESVDKILLKSLAIQQNCPRAEVYRDAVWNIEELTVQQAVDESAGVEDEDSVIMRSIFSVGDTKVRENETYEFVGVSIANPRDQYSVVQAWHAEQVGTDIDTFEMSPSVRKRLELFQVDQEWNEDSPYDKMREIADDMAYNVTGIFGRPILHMAYDLVWHSVLDFNFAGKPVGRGYIDAIAIGDTRTGKSEIAMHLMKHYQSGVLKSLDRSSVAGIVGGAETKGTNRKWGVTWGILPRNHRRMVVFDEASSAKPQVFEQLTSVRSSGVAEVNLMGGQRANAKVRLMWLTNPVDNRSLRDLPRGGMDGIKEIFTAPEDIARFDFAMAVDGEAVPDHMIKKENNEEVWHAYNSDDCRLLINWVWSRKPHQVIWEDGLEDKVFEVAKDFASKFIDDPPLVQGRDFRIKLARLTVAVAARVFSTDESGEYVMVKYEHLYAAIRFLDEIYGDPKFGYAKYSADVIRRRMRNQRDRENLQDWLEAHDDAANVLLSLRYRRTFKKRDFEEVGRGIDSMEASEVMGYLVDNEMVLDVGEGKYKFSDTLRTVITEMYEERQHLRDIEIDMED